MLHRFARSLLFATLFALAAGSAVSAATVTREPLELPPLIEDNTCGYTILVTFPVNQQVITTRYDASGEPVSMVITGRLLVTFTNPDTGEILTANISGPSKIGHDGVFYFLGKFGGQLTETDLVLFSGRINGDTLEVRGHLSLDVCEAMAPPA